MSVYWPGDDEMARTSDTLLVEIYRGRWEEGYLRDSDGSHLPPSPPSALSVIMSFVKLSIFGTSFEVRPHHHQPSMP